MEKELRGGSVARMGPKSDGWVSGRGLINEVDLHYHFSYCKKEFALATSAANWACPQQ